MTQLLYVGSLLNDSKNSACTFAAKLGNKRNVKLFTCSRKHTKVDSENNNPHLTQNIVLDIYFMNIPYFYLKYIPSFLFLN